MKTKVAITVQNKRTISEHAGRCKNYLIYTIENSEVTQKYLLELTEEETLHNLFHNGNAGASILFDMNIILTRGIGQGAINKLASHNIVCLKVDEKDPEQAIEKLINGTLEAYAPISVEACGCNCGDGHKHNHDHHQNHQHGHQHNHSCKGND
jgi:predicted Fe-Mo cluster-binding NifX family protein